jgi:hypothetical protein
VHVSQQAQTSEYADGKAQCQWQLTIVFEVCQKRCSHCNFGGIGREDNEIGNP